MVRVLNSGPRGQELDFQINPITRVDHQVSLYHARGPDPDAWQTNTLGIEWDRWLDYAFLVSPSSLGFLSNKNRRTARSPLGTFLAL